MQPDTTWTLRIHLDADRGEVVASLIEAGHQGLSWGLLSDTKACWYGFQKRPSLALIDAIGAWLAGLGAADAELWTWGPDGLWQPGWRGWWQGLRLSPRFAIALPDSPPAAHVAHTLWLEPGGGFGSGHHPTTSLALAMLDDTLGAHPPGALLDVGCGTGILSIAAATLGWQTLGVDTDGHAVEVAERHAEGNDVAALCRWQAGTLTAEMGRFDVVVANLPSGLLVDLGGLLAACTTSDLILSGADHDTRERVVAAASPLQVVDERTEGDWVGLRLRRSGTP